jgi:DNA-binding NtrC family response regulator
MPPLRECMGELPRVVEWMLSRLNDEGKAVTGLSAAAWDVLKAHDWPGNLAELFAVLREARLRSEKGEIGRDDLPLSLRSASEPAARPMRVIDLEAVLAEAERRLIRLALARASGNRTRAAELLSMPRAKLLRRIEALGMDGE